MGRFIVVAAIVAAVAVPASAQSRDRIVRTINESFDAENYDGVTLRIDVGEIDVRGVDGESIAIRIDVHCARGRDRERCEDRAEDVELDSFDRRGNLVVDIDGTGLWRSRDAHVEVTLSVPRGLATEIELGTGELRIEDVTGNISVEMSLGEVRMSGVRGDVFVDLGMGDVNISMSQDAVGEVTLDNGVGETELRHRDGRNAIEGILGGTDVHWNSGTGPHSVKVELNVGEIFVRLQ